jgi:hypothetical protein
VVPWPLWAKHKIAKLMMRSAARWHWIGWRLGGYVLPVRGMHVQVRGLCAKAGALLGHAVIELMTVGAVMAHGMVWLTGR